MSQPYNHQPTPLPLHSTDALASPTVAVTEPLWKSGIVWPKELRPLIPQTPWSAVSSIRIEQRNDDDSEASSDDDAMIEDRYDEKFLGDGVRAEEGRVGVVKTRSTLGGGRKRRTLCLYFLTILFGCLFSAFTLSHLFRGRSTYRGKGLLPISINHLKNGTFSIEREELAWLAEAGDGVYSHPDPDGSILLEDVNTATSRVLVQGDSIRDESGRKLGWSKFTVSADLKYILLASDTRQQWRHSSHSNFYVHNIEAKTTVPLRTRETTPHTAIASFSPKNHHIAFVHANDLYVYDTPPESSERHSTAIRITVDGSPTTFNGVPDWVYEEEVFQGDSTSWWSPDGSKLAYLSFDEERVPEYTFPIYNPSPYQPGGDPFPGEVIMRYPKPGYPNPIVTIHVFDLAKYTVSTIRPTPAEYEAQQGESPRLDPRVIATTYDLVLSDPFDEDDTIVSEVTWVGKDDLMIKVSNRNGQILRVAHFRLSEADTSSASDRKIVGQVVRDEDYGKKDGGWIEVEQTIVGIDSTLLLHSHVATDRPKPSYPAGYLDIIPDENGYRHLAYFSPPDSPKPTFLTKGEWEIVGGIQAIDIEKGLVYFVAANPSIERHVYSVPLPKDSGELSAMASGVEEPTPLTDTKVKGYHSVSFSPFGGFYVLSYQGPAIPWQKLVKVDDHDFTKTLQDNQRLAETDAHFQKVDISYDTLTLSAGQTLNMMELRPPLMDTSGRTKYPLLVQVYGGPNSQMVDTKFQRDWHHFLVTSLGYVVIRIDPRGTGFKGRRFRAPVRNQLGKLEAQDVVEATQSILSHHRFLDSKRVGIWGWSYGGFLTSKIVETNSSVFTTAISVAPVTDFRYYDSIYTERYMSTPKDNIDGYRGTAVTHMEGFKHLDFALAHGSGDDNGQFEGRIKPKKELVLDINSERPFLTAVHFLNSAALLDRLTSASVQGFRFRMFTDSDHGISKRGSYWELMQWITDFLFEKWGEGGMSEQKWRAHTKDHIIEKRD